MSGPDEFLAIMYGLAGLIGWVIMMNAIAYLLNRRPNDTVL